MDEVTIMTTSDTPDQVRAALGLPAEPVTPPVTETPAAETPEVTPDAEKTPEVKPDAKPAEKPAAKAEEKPKPAEKPAEDKKGRFQERIDEVTREKYEAIAEANRLKAELDAVKAAAAKPATETAPPAEPVKVAEVRPKPKEDDYPVFSDFIEALTDWKTETKTAEKAAELRADLEREQKERRQAAEQAERKTLFETKLAKGKESHPDYDAVLAKSANVNVGPIVRGFLQSDECAAPAELIYYLATNPAEVDRIKTLPPPAQIREMIRLELRHEGGSLFPEKTADEAPAEETPAETPAAEGKKVPVSKAPAPVGRVGQGGSIPAKDPSQMNYAEYKAWRAAKK